MSRIILLLCLGIVVIQGPEGVLSLVAKPDVGGKRLLSPRYHHHDCCGTSQRNQLLSRLGVLERKIDEIFASIVHWHCPHGWQAFGGSCYKVSGKATSWATARADCQREHADLVTISSAEENAFVLKLLREQSPSTKQAWIGFTRTRVGAPFAWADGTTSRYTSWAKGEPNYPKSEHCAWIYTAPGRPGRTPGTWNNYRCGGSNSWPAGHVCELRHGHGGQ